MRGGDKNNQQHFVLSPKKTLVFQRDFQQKPMVLKNGVEVDETMRQFSSLSFSKGVLLTYIAIADPRTKGEETAAALRSILE